MAQVSKFVLEGDKWVIDKDPGSTLDYDWPWATWLAGISDTIDSIVSVTPAGGVEIAEPAPAIVGGTKVKVWVSGGTVSKTKLGSVTVKIRTVGGRIDERTAYFRIVQR